MNETITSKGKVFAALEAIASDKSIIAIQVQDGRGDIETHKAGCRDIKRAADKAVFRTGMVRLFEIRSSEDLADDVANGIDPQKRPCCNGII